MGGQDLEEQEYLRRSFASLTEEHKIFAIKVAESFLIMQNAPEAVQDYLGFSYPSREPVETHGAKSVAEDKLMYG